MRDRHANAPGGVRHVALSVVGSRMRVYYSRIGDSPERIYFATVNLDDDPDDWKAGSAELVISPGTPWEGAHLPLHNSVVGAASGPENALRDPAIFLSEGKTYLLYACAGENGIGIAEIEHVE